jgi:molecular chaperone DnaJ
MNNLYEILGVSKTATTEEIKKSHRDKVKESHPDRGGDAEKFKQIQEAYEVLSDPNKRAQYDQFGTVTPQQPFHQNPFTHFSTIFEQFVNGGAKPRGNNVQVKLEITLEEAFTGVKKPVSVPSKVHCSKCSGCGLTDLHPCKACNGAGQMHVVKQANYHVYTTCQACRGSGKSGTNCSDCAGNGWIANGEKVLDIDIPRGMENGLQIRVSGQGEPGKNQAPPGDLFIAIFVKKHDLFERQGKDLFIEVPVTFSELVLGREMTIPTLLKDEKLTFVIPPSTEDGSEFRLGGKGMPDWRGRGQGDIVAIVRVDIPEINEEYKKVLEKLSKVEKKYVSDKRKAFDAKVN